MFKSQGRLTIAIRWLGLHYFETQSGLLSQTKDSSTVFAQTNYLYLLSEGGQILWLRLQYFETRVSCLKAVRSWSYYGQTAVFRNSGLSSEGGQILVILWLRLQCFETRVSRLKAVRSWSYYG